ncbi:hypothetical protein [Desulfosporosinus sp. OT]|uniref:hypothetical protein n=1 Tax=Desulfosporosinus sp. OT TaxID=913865 RepID=UPI000223A1DA|nr:hypothetical protein [Desulfosporosinus sp. OT]EGW37202.1 hypothetical protein DOT_4741 [Desulfosporosinus sp. OT]
MSKKILFIALAFVIIIGGVFALSNQVIISNNITARNFLNEVKKGDFGNAFNYVEYYDVGDDVSPQTSYEKAKDIWTSRMIKLKQEGIYLTNYKDLTGYMDDGYPKGEVTLLLSNNGEIEEQKCSIHFSKLSKKWKIEDLYFYNSNHIFERMISGDVKVK